MKKRLIFPIAIGLSLAWVIVLSIILCNENTSKKTIEQDEISSLRSQHMAYLNNSPFKDIKHLTKKERRKLRLPPDRYYDQMWELSMNPTTGRPEPEKVTAIRQQLRNKRAQRAPGDSPNNPWIERGPNNVGGRTRALLFDPNDVTNRRVYSGGVSGGLWVNNDITSANSQWSRVENVPGNLNVTSITVDPRNSNNWYLGTGEQHSFDDVVGNGIYRSTDGGTTWQALNIPAAGGGNFNQNNNLFLAGIYYVTEIVVWNNRQQNRTELFVGVGSHQHNDSENPSDFLGPQSAGLYRSIDNGATWNRIESANFRFTNNNRTFYYIPNDFEIGADNRLWMSTVGHFVFGNEGGGRIYSTTDGNTWTEASISPIADTDRVEIEASVTNPDKLYVLAEGTTATTPVAIFKTTDKFATAANFTRLGLPNDADTGINANDFTREQAFYDLMIEVDPTNDGILYVGGIDLFKSVNDGVNWTQISRWTNTINLNVSLVHADHHAMTFRPNNSNQAIFGTDGGVYFANNLANTPNSENAIQARNTGYNVTQFVKAAIGPESEGSQNVIFTAGAQDNGTQIFRNATAGINSSEEIGFGDGFFNFIDRDGQFIITTNFRNNATRFDLPWDGNGQAENGGTLILNFEGGDFVNQMGYDSDANLLLTNASNDSGFLGIFTVDVTNDTGATGQDIIQNPLLTVKPTAFTPSPFAVNTWLVGLANGNLLQLTDVGVQTANWAAINTPFVGSISSIRYGANVNDIMVTIHNYGVTSIWSTSDGGVNWVSKEGNLPDMPVRDILQNPLDRREAIVATQLGVWGTTNFNAANPNWTRFQNGMSDVSVTSFDYWAINGDDNDNRVIASTYGRGVFTGSFDLNPGVVFTPIPRDLVASNITDASIDLSWTAPQNNGTPFTYELLQDGVVIQENLNVTNFQVQGLNIGTSYTFIVRAKDSRGNTSGNGRRITVSTLPDYCDSDGNTDEEFISNVTLGSINNSSMGSNTGYSDFTGISTNLNKGVESSISITPTFVVDVLDENFGVWIDYNQDNDFNDAEERIVTLTDTTTVTQRFIVPNDAINGATRMRISMNGVSNPTPCEEDFLFGEVEDYTVIIQDAPNNVNAAANGTKSDTKNTDVLLYPNPVSHSQKLTIDLSKFTTDTFYSISTITGAKVQNGKLSTKAQSIEINELKSGIYFMTVRNKQTTNIKRFMVK